MKGAWLKDGVTRLTVGGVTLPPRASGGSFRLGFDLLTERGDLVGHLLGEPGMKIEHLKLQVRPPGGLMSIDRHQHPPGQRAYTPASDSFGPPYQDRIRLRHSPLLHVPRWLPQWLRRTQNGGQA